MRSTVVVLVGTLLALAGGVAMSLVVEGDVRARLDERGDRVAAVIDLHLRRYGSASQAVAALRATDPSQAEWVDRVQRLGIRDDLPSVFSVAVTTLLLPDEVAEYETSRGRTLGLDVVIRPPLSERTAAPERLLVIDRVAPLARNRAALGLDVLAVPGAIRAATRAIDQEVASLSDALTLVQEPGEQTGLVVYAPWYHEDGRLGGATDLVLRGQDLLDAIVDEIGDVGVRVTDAVGDDTREIGRLMPAAGVDQDLSVRRTVEPLGQVWEVEITAPVGFASGSERAAGTLTALALLVSTVLVAALVSVLRRRADDLRREVDARTVELVASNRELGEALAAKDEFLAVVTHEFRTPIAVIRGFTETLAAGRVGEVSDDVHALLSRIDAQASRLHSLADNLLTAADLRAGELTVHTEVVDVTLLVRAVASRLLVATPPQLVLESPLPVFVDAGHTVRALDGVVSNAVKYGRAPITISATAEDGHAVVRVSDSGDGVPPDVAARMFQPFEQADRGDMRRSQGLGLGLSVVRRLCDQMDSSVRLLPDEGPGATFELRFPLAAEPQAGSTPEVPSVVRTTDD